MSHKLIIAAALSLALWAAGCKDEKKGQPPKQAGGPSTQPVKDDHEEQSIPLGSQTAGGLTVKVDSEGAVKAGEKEAHLDVTVTGGEKPKAVRVWVGIESATGSVKAKADPQEAADGTHIHAEIPNPLPPGSKVWVELETSTGTHKASFAIKQ
jgi:hypothetical protein